MKILVTGVAGFIGFHLAKALIHNKKNIIGIDNINDYYDVNLKKSRLSKLKEIGLIFHKIDISKKNILEKFLLNEKFDVIIHLAAQAGVRYSIENPQAYIDSNITGFFNILEGSRHQNIKHLIYASSSSVYAGNASPPFEEKQSVETPQNLYAASKKSNELMSYSYSHLFKIPCTGLRFFTVYGPWGRPDMFLFKFVDSILKNKIISIFNYGKHSRDFTFIDDIVNGTIKACFNKSYIFKNNKLVPSRVFNLAYGKSVKLLDFISIIEKNLKHKAKKKFLPLQKGDVLKTYADITLAKKKLKYSPKINYKIGIRRFIEWYLQNEKKL